MYQNPVVCEWYKLGLNLDIDASKLETIEHSNHHDIQDYKKKMVKLWMSSPQCKQTWTFLVKALRAIRVNGIPTLIVKKERKCKDFDAVLNDDVYSLINQCS